MEHDSSSAMPRLLIDQNFDERIVRAIKLRAPGLDAVLVRDVGLAAAEDPEILAWAAAQGRVLVTHDAKTVPPFAYDRLVAAQPMAGVILVRTSVSIRVAIEELLMIISCCRPEELNGQVYDLPI